MLLKIKKAKYLHHRLSNNIMPRQIFIDWTKLYVASTRQLQRYVSYSDRSLEGRNFAAEKRNRQWYRSAISARDKEAVHGPPDRVCHFVNEKRKRRYYHILLACTIIIIIVTSQFSTFGRELSTWSDDDFEDNTSFTYPQPDVKYMGEKLNMNFDVGNGEILKPLMVKYSALILSWRSMVYTFLSMEKLSHQTHSIRR